jgi:hypothetical protein
MKLYKLLVCMRFLLFMVLVIAYMFTPFGSMVDASFKSADSIVVSMLFIWLISTELVIFIFVDHFDG